MNLLEASDSCKVFRNPSFPFMIAQLRAEEVWNSRGCGGAFYNKEWSFCIPLVPNPEDAVLLSHMILPNFYDSGDTFLVLLCHNDPRFVKPVEQYELLWTDEDSGGDRDGSVWRGISPSAEFVVMGDAVAAGHDCPPPPGSIYAIRREFARAVGPEHLQFIVNDKESKAKRDASFWLLYRSICLCSTTHDVAGIGADRVFAPSPAVLFYGRSATTDFDNLSYWDMLNHVMHIPYNRQCVFATHNSTSLKAGGSIVANQTHGIRRQLADGVRGFKLPIALSAEGAFAEFGRVMGSLFSKSKRKDAEKLCLFVAHSGGRSRMLDPTNVKFSSALEDVRDFLNADASAVVTLVLNIMASGYDMQQVFPMIIEDFARAGLRDRMYIQDRERPYSWPTPFDMVANRKQLVVFVDESNSPFPELHYTKHFLAETHFEFKRVRELNERLRSDYDTHHLRNAMFMQHQYLLGLAAGKRSLAERANMYENIMKRVDLLCTMHGKLPSIVQFDFYEQGDCHRAIVEINRRWIGYFTLEMNPPFSSSSSCLHDDSHVIDEIVENNLSQLGNIDDIQE